MKKLQKNTAIFLFFTVLFPFHFAYSNSFNNRLNKPTPPWMVEQINKSLSPFDFELSKEFLDNLFQNNRNSYELMRIKHTKGKLSFTYAGSHPVAGKWHKIFSAMEQLKRLPAKDFDLCISCHDTISCPSCFHLEMSNGVCICKKNDDLISTVNHLPIFIQSDCDHDHFIIFPDFLHVETLIEAKEILNSRINWNKKLPMLLFRGGDSGIFDKNNWPLFPRPKLMELSLQHPHLLDAKFSIRISSREWEPYARSRGMIGNYIPLSHHNHYKYLLDIDGNCTSNPRNQLLMFCNSVILKVKSNSKSWFYPCIKPYVHYIPVEADLSNLLSQLKWAKSHDNECKIISKNALNLAKELITEETIHLYIYRLLEAYAEKQARVY